MLTREQVRGTIDKLPDNFTIDQLIDHLIFIDKVDEGLNQSKADKVHTQEEAKQKLKKWLK